MNENTRFKLANENSTITDVEVVDRRKQFLSKNELIVLSVIILIITFLSAINFLPVYNLKLYLMSSVIIMLLIGSYIDFKIKQIENVVIYPLIIILSLLTLINISENGFGIFNFITITTLLTLYYYNKDNIINIGGADVKLLIPLIASLNFINLIAFIMIIGDILFLSIIINRFRNIDIPFFPIITTSYIMLFLLNDILNKIVI